jgi:hypothetical protein
MNQNSAELSRRTPGVFGIGIRLADALHPGDPATWADHGRDDRRQREIHKSDPELLVRVQEYGEPDQTTVHVEGRTP